MSLEFLAEHGIRASEFQFRASRGSGPGGQNVNKVNSKVTLRWNPSSSGLRQDIKSRFFTRFGKSLTTEGELVIQSDEHRDQTRNKEACLERLARMIKAVLVPPKKRRKTKPKAGAKEKRLTGKKKRSGVKAMRSRPGDE